MQNNHVIVIGAGIGGLTAACLLAKSGYRVTVLEKNNTPGGKMQQFSRDGFRFDTGPSLLTMPFLLEKLFEECGFSLGDHLTLAELSLLCRYNYPDGTLFDNYSDRNKTISEITNFAPEDAGSYTRFLDYSEDLYRKTADSFIFNPLCSLSDFSGLKISDLLKINPFSTVSQQVDSYFESEYLRKFFKRFSTYNGSSPFLAPATLNVIPHIELNLGGYYVHGGLGKIVESLHEIAVQMGVHFRFEEEVVRISVSDKKATSCVLMNGSEIACDLIFSNADSAETVLKLLPKEAAPPLEQYRQRSAEPSSSAFVILAAVNKQWDLLHHHNIFFSDDYEDEFHEIFQQKKMPEDPTIYVTNSSVTDPDDAPAGSSNLFILVNAPYVTEHQNWTKISDTYPRKVFKKLEESGLHGLREQLLYSEVLTPEHFKGTYHTNKGGIYGTSSNRISSAFIRPRNKFRHLSNLYMVGGSTHPGGGIPLVLQSAFNAVRLLEEERS